MRGRSRFILTVLAFGYAFLYIPLLSVVVYSFNDSQLATVWGGFSVSETIRQQNDICCLKGTEMVCFDRAKRPDKKLFIRPDFANISP